jgi:hypothetical protein
MSGENAEIGYVLSSGVEGTAMLIKGSVAAVQALMKFMQWMAKRVKTGHLKPKEYRDLQKFIQQSNGNINYLNIPAEDARYIERVKEDLQKMKVPYHILPDLNTGDGMMQIVYSADYKEMVTAWFQNYCTQRLEEGNFKQQKTLTALAGGEARTGIVTIPTEDVKLLDEMEYDFEDMHLSYCLMPDVNVGDGTREVMYAKQDEEKIQHWLENFCQKHIVQGGEKTAKELQTLAGNKSQVGFINIPVNKGKATLKQMREDFQLLGVNYHVMNDVRAGDGLVQVMYLKKDETAVRNWYSNYATDQLVKGGEHKYKDLINLTNGKTQIVSMSLSGEALAAMKADFKSLHVNYTMLPQLKTNDANIMLMYAAADAQRIKSWYTMYQEKVLQETGDVLPEMTNLTMEQYTEGAQMSAEDYMATEAPAQKASVEGELQKLEVPKKNLNENPDYLQMDANPAYEKVTVNESLVAGMQREGAFISRIPGDSDSYLVCNNRNVFESDINISTGKGKTYIMFLPKDGRNLIMDRDGKWKERMSTEELMKHYDPVERDFSKTVVNDLEKTVKAGEQHKIRK